MKRKWGSVGEKTREKKAVGRPPLPPIANVQAGSVAREETMGRR